MSTKKIIPDQDLSLEDKARHEYYMSLALLEANKARKKDEIPIGAVIVKDGEILARTHNLKESLQNPVAHAELLAVEQAAKKIGNWHLDDCTLYVTVEPCAMCAGAIIQARVPTVIYGAKNEKGGAVESSFALFEQKGVNHHPVIISGILNKACQQMISGYFKEKREKLV